MGSSTWAHYARTLGTRISKAQSSPKTPCCSPMPSTNTQEYTDLNTWAWNYWVPMTGSMSFILTLRVQQVRDLQTMQISLLTFCTNITPSMFTQRGSCIVTLTERLTHED